MANLANKAGKLTWNVPIVNKDGTPTNEFMLKWLAQSRVNGIIPDLSTAAEVSAVLDVIGMAEGDILFRSATQWVVLAPGTAGYILKTGGPAALPVWESVSSALDGIGATKGDILYRDTAVWTVLAPAPTNGFVLTWDTATGIPAWKAPGGGGSLIGSGVPTSLQPAGTLYSRNDAAGVYVSTPTATGGAVVQTLSSIQGNTVPGSLTLTTAPTPGNLIMVWIPWGNNNSNMPTVDTTKWTVFASIPGISTYVTGFGLYRYVQAGDTAVMPAFCTAGSNYWAAQVWEIAGVSGVFATDVPVIQDASTQTNAVTVGLTTSAPGQLCFIGAGQYNGPADPANGTAGWAFDSAAHNSTYFGNVGGWHQTVASSGVAISAAMASTGGTYNFAAVIFAVTVASVMTAGWTLVGPGGSGTAQAETFALITGSLRI